MGEADVHVTGQSFYGVTININIIELFENPHFEPLSQGRETFTFCMHFFLSNLASFAQTDNPRHIERPRSHAALVAAAVNHLSNFGPRLSQAHIDRANSFGAVH